MIEIPPQIAHHGLGSPRISTQISTGRQILYTKELQIIDALLSERKHDPLLLRCELCVVTSSELYNGKMDKHYLRQVTKINWQDVPLSCKWHISFVVFLPSPNLMRNVQEKPRLKTFYKLPGQFVSTPSKSSEDKESLRNHHSPEEPKVT